MDDNIVCPRAGVLLVFIITMVVVSAFADAADKPPVGKIAASAGDEVVIVDPTTGSSQSVSSGPVAWLFPAPGGVLFAPDLVNGRTTVIDLRTMTVGEPILGVTMPRFGSLTDRYLVLSKQLLVVSYPDRALMNRFEIAFERPWQVEVLAGNTVLIVLERTPGGGGDSSLTAVSLGEGQLVYRRPLDGDVRHFAVSPQLGVMALAQAAFEQVVIVDPATLTPVADFRTSGAPIDVVFAADESVLIAAVAVDDTGGELLIWRLKQEEKRGMVRKKEWRVSLAAAPTRLARSPDGRHVAVALSTGEIDVFEVKNQKRVAIAKLQQAPRDVVWCDPSSEGPLLPDWSDSHEPTLNLGGP